FLLFVVVSLPVLHSFPTRRSSDLPGKPLAVYRSSDQFRKLSALMSPPAFSSQNLPRLLMGVRVPVFCVHMRSETLIICDCAMARSEEHTSELQSRENLVCRLLLEK